MFLARRRDAELSAGRRSRVHAGDEFAIRCVWKAEPPLRSERISKQSGIPNESSAVLQRALQGRVQEHAAKIRIATTQS